MSYTVVPNSGNKSFVVTWLLSWLLGPLGIDRFYLGKIGTGLLKLFTIGGFGVWALIDLIITLAGGQTDSNGQRLAGYDQYKLVAILVTVGVAVLSAGGGGISGLFSSN